MITLQMENEDRDIVFLRFAGLMQSWGSEVNQAPNATSPRSTLPFPTKSAVIGIIRSAKGQERELSPRRLSSFDRGLVDSNLWVREDAPGIISRDYQVAQVENLHGHSSGEKNRQVPKMFLQNAVFTLALEVPSEMSAEIKDSLMNPVWSTYLGRRAHVPFGPEYIGTLRGASPYQVLREAPLPDTSFSTEGRTVRFITPEKVSDESYPIKVNDGFLESFHPLKRKYGARHIYSHYDFIAQEGSEASESNNYSEMLNHYLRFDDFLRKREGYVHQ